MSDRVIVIAGPTASGKTALAISLAQKLGAPIINADSRQVYRELNIGVAKPSAEELQAAKHHLISYVSIEDSYSAGRWSKDARKVLSAYFSSKGSLTATTDDRYLIISGGSGLHVKSLVEGIPEMPKVSPETRAFYTAKFENEGLNALQLELQEKDEAYFNLVDQKNPHRLMRALSAIRDSGKTFTALRAAPRTPIQQQVSWIKLSPDRDTLYQRINQRVDQMILDGLEEEVNGFAERRSLDALQTIGYREWWPYFDGEYERNQAVALIKQSTRRYARRQLTWNRKLPGLILETLDEEKALEYILSSKNHNG